MKTGLRFLLAMFLMLAVFVVTNLLFPPVAPDPVQAPAGEATRPQAGEPAVREEVDVDRPFEAPRDDNPERLVTVETPLFDMTFTTRGARIRSIRLPAYESFQREGPVEMVPEGVEGVLGATWLYGGGADSVALDRYRYTVSPADGIRLSEGSGPRTLTFRYDYPEGQFFSEIRYTFTADSYLVEVEGDLPAVERSALFVDLGPGLAINELQESEDWRAMAYLGNHAEDGTRTRPLSRVDEPEVVEGPLRWAAVKSKYFVQVILPGDGISVGDYLTAMWAEPLPVEGRASVQVASPVGDDGSYSYRAYLGPIERERLVAIGNDLEEVNPYGWRIFRPIIRPLVAVILWVVRVLHGEPAAGVRLGADRDRGADAGSSVAPAAQGDARAGQHDERAAAGTGDQEQVPERPAADAAGDDEAVQGTRRQSVRGVRADADSHAHADRAVPGLPDHDRTPRRVVHVASGPVRRGPLLYPPALAGSQHVPAAVHHVQDESGAGDGESADEDDDVHHAGLHDRALLRGGRPGSTSTTSPSTSRRFRSRS